MLLLSVECVTLDDSEGMLPSLLLSRPEWLKLVGSLLHLEVNTDEQGMSNKREKADCLVNQLRHWMKSHL